MTITDLLADRPVAYHPALARALGGVGAGLLLCQLLYWTRTLPPGRGGWFWKTAKELRAETAMTRCEQETAREKLKKKGVLHEKKMGMPAKVWFRVDVEQLEKLLKNQQDAGSQQSRMLNIDNHDCGYSPIKDDEYPHTPESTPESPSETTITTKTTTPTPPAAGGDGEAGGGGGLRPSDSSKAKTDIDEYLDLGMRYGGDRGGPPRTPPAWRSSARTRIAKAGGLQSYDITQMEAWRRKAAAKDEAAAKAAREVAAAAEEDAAKKAVADEASRLDALYDALSAAERDCIDAMVRDQVPEDLRGIACCLLGCRRAVMAEMYPPVGTQADDRRLSDPAPDEPLADHGQEARGKVQDLVAGIAARCDVRSPTWPRMSSAASREARDRAREEEMRRQARQILEAQ